MSSDGRGEKMEEEEGNSIAYAQLLTLQTSLDSSVRETTFLHKPSLKLPGYV